WGAARLGCRCGGVVRRAAPGGSAAPAAPPPRPADRSDPRRPRVDKFDGAPPSTSLFAITASLSPANHAIRGDTADFWVKLSVSVCRIGQRKRHFGSLSPRAIFGVSFSGDAVAA